MSDKCCKPIVTDDEKIFDRVEKEGVAVTSVTDGHVFAFSAEVLKRLLADAEGSPQQAAMVFVRRENQVKA